MTQAFSQTGLRVVLQGNRNQQKVFLADVASLPNFYLIAYPQG